MIQRSQGAVETKAPAPHTEGGTSIPGKYSRDEEALLTFLEREPLHIDELGRLLQWSASQVASILLSLELKGAVRQLPGKHFAIMMDGY